MLVFERGTQHQQIVFCQDQAAGLRAIIAIYSTALGPALGGTRFYPYPNEGAALADVLDLSRAMAYKAAGAGLPLGGGKAVIIGDPGRDKTEALLLAYGRFIDSLGGRYITACDVGTYVDDMAVVAKESRFVTGRPLSDGGSGDSSLLTAYGVFRAMCATADWTWGRPTLRGRRVGILGVGKVGRRLVDYLISAGARVVIADSDPSAVAHVRAAHADVEVAEPAALHTIDLDIYAPCAMGHVLDEDVVTRLQAAVVCGAANNQLAAPEIDEFMRSRGIRYAPDYVANAGGLIQVYDETLGYDQARAETRASRIFDTVRTIFDYADAHDIAPGRAADRIAEQRLEAGTSQTTGS